MTHVRRRVSRRDGNHTAIQQALERLGCEVADTSGQGGGYPDLTVAKRGRIVLVEIKDPTQDLTHQRLTPAQVKFHARWQAQGAPIFVVKTIDEAIDAVFERVRR